MESKELTKALGSISKVIHSIKTSAKNAIKAIGGNIDKDAHEGNAVAQYVAYTHELNYYLALQLQNDRILAITKDTSARRKLLKRRSLIQQEILYYQGLQEEAVQKGPVE